MGHSAARDELYNAVYSELRQIAASMPRVGGYGDTLQPTVLANEVFLQLERRFPAAPAEIPESRATFYWSVALAMRTIIRDHWRASNAAKRGGDHNKMQLGQLDPSSPRPIEEDSAIDALVLDATIERLKEFDERWHRVVMYRYYANRTIEETAAMLGVAPSTVKRDWQLARAWLLREIEGGS